jgi:gamma-glutamylcysteine synthetase
LQDFLAGKLPRIPGELPTLNDWENHLTTIYPEVCCLLVLQFNWYKYYFVNCFAAFL